MAYFSAPIDIVHALAALEAQRIAERRGKIARVGEGELVGVGHRRTISEREERNKNEDRARAGRDDAAGPGEFLIDPPFMAGSSEPM